MEKKSIAEQTNGFDSDMAYPQYANRYGSHTVISTNTWIRLQEYVLEISNSPLRGANQEVRKHWDSILAGIIPFGIRIVKEEM